MDEPGPDKAENAVLAYRLFIMARHGEIKRELRGKDLACFCKPGSPCHADVLLEIANS
jgi:hypothetical protein